MRSPRVPCILLALTAVLTAAAQSPKDEEIEPVEKLAEVEALYAAGDYEACGTLADVYLEEAVESRTYYPKAVISRFYRLKALLAYAYREEGYREEVDAFLLQAIASDLDLSIGTASEVPLYVLERFVAISGEYMGQFGKRVRRHAVGLYGALVLEPTVFQNPALLQPGLHYSLNLSRSLSLFVDVRIPLAWPPWDFIRGQTGVVWMPGYRVEKFGMGVSAFYLFGLDQLTTFTHSISFGGNLEYIGRRGFGFGGSAELLRLDLIFGLADETDLPVYKAIDIAGSFLRLVFANINFYLFYTF